MMMMIVDMRVDMIVMVMIVRLIVVMMIVAMIMMNMRMHPQASRALVQQPAADGHNRHPRNHFQPLSQPLRHEILRQEQRRNS